MAARLLFILAAAILLDVMWARLFPEKRTLMESTEVCKSKECVYRAKMILSFVNQTADPCDDFHSYACGKRVINTDTSEHSGFNEIQKIQYENEEVVKDIWANLPTINEPKNSTEVIIMMYQSCMHLNRSEEEEMDDIRRVLNESGFGAWPMRSTKTGYTSKPKSLEQLFLSTDSSIFFTLTVNYDPLNPFLDIIWVEITKPTNALQHGLPYSLKQASKHNKTLVKPIQNASTETYMNLLDMIRPKSSPEDQLSVIRVYGQLSENITKKSKVRSKEPFWRTTFKELETEIPSFPLLNVINGRLRDVNITLNEDDAIVIKKPDAFNSTIHYLLEEDIDNIYNYMGMEMATMLMQRTSGAYLEKRRQINLKYELPIPRDTKSQDCRQLFELVPAILGRMYILQKFDQKQRAEARDVLNRIGKAYYDNLKFLSWMDLSTRLNALDKVWKISPIVGFSDDVMTDTSIESLAHTLKGVGRKDTAKMTYLVLKKISERKLLHPKGISDETHAYQEVNAYYTFSANEVVIPAGILKNILFTAGVPTYLNLGSIGAIMGHEITHGFDVQGSKRDGEGKFVDWWTNYSQEVFKERANCFLEQYENIVDPVTNLSLNGNHTLSENIGDNVGIRVAFKAFRELEENERNIMLPELENFTPEQLFFISFAMPWCSVQDPHVIRRYINGGRYTPDKYRIIVPLQNMEEFAAAFQCKKGTRMRLTDYERCVLW